MIMPLRKPTSASFDIEADQLDGPGKCGCWEAVPGRDRLPVNGRCGPGTRLPFLVISPWAKANYVSHARVSLASVTRFIEDTWKAAWSTDRWRFVRRDFRFDRRWRSICRPRVTTSRFTLDPGTGNPLTAPPASP